MTMSKAHRHQRVSQVTVRFDMNIDLCIISGLMFGFEYVEVVDDEERYIVVDFAFLRILINF